MQIVVFNKKEAIRGEQGKFRISEQVVTISDSDGDA